MIEDKINSGESEGSFNDFIDEQINDRIEDILNSGGIDAGNGSDIIIEMDDISPPRFSYGDNDGGGDGKGSNGPGEGSEKLRFTVPFDHFMELMARRLGLPDLKKQGNGRIKEFSYEFKNFGQTGIILDRRRTFKKALKSSVGSGTYNPEKNKWTVAIHRRDKRYKVPERIEKPRYKAVVFYMGDISYSTYGERLELEKKVINFIYSWLNYNYGEGNVDHRFFVHDAEAHEVLPEQFFQVSNAGGTRASIVFDLVSQISFNEYDTESTNFYAFYFGDGELFGDDATEISTILNERLCPVFNRIGIVEVKGSQYSTLRKELLKEFSTSSIVRLGSLESNDGIISVIKKMFGGKK